jgi:hypothetical protein
MRMAPDDIVIAELQAEPVAARRHRHARAPA